MNYFTYKGVYEFKASQSLGTENKFNLDNSFDGKTFNFWGVDMIESISPFYISEEGSRITFAYLTDDESALPPIYPNEDINTPLSNCKTIKMTLYGQEGNLIYCDIKKEELQYFNYPNSTSKQVVYDVLCGYKESFSYVFLLDKNNYASFNITEFKLPESKILLDKTILTFVAEIDGHLEGYKDSNNYFLSFVNVEKNNTNTTGEILCVLEKYNKTVTQLELQCILFLEQTMEFDNLYLLPYHLTYEMPDHNENQVPFEIIIKKEIKAGDSPEPGPEPEPSFSRYSRVSFGLILALLLMF